MSVMGGGERVAIHSMLAALRANHSVTLLSEHFDEARVEDFFGCEGLFERVNRLTYPEFKPLIGSGFLLYQRILYHQRQFGKVLPGETRFDLVLGTQDIGYIPKLSAPIVQYCYFPEYFKHLESAPSSPLWRLYYGPARKFYRQRARTISRLISTSDYTKGFVKQIWGRESRTIYPPCPVDFYSSARQQKENLAVTVGRIVPDKRMNLFIEIARNLPAMNFIIVGSVRSQNDAHYVSLKNAAPSNLSIILSPLRKVKDILGRAKVYVHCMENEHFGITIVEAMAAGCVPVVHDSGGPKEIVTKDVGFKWKNVREATAQVSSIMTDGNLQDRLSSASAKRSWTFSDEAFETSLINTLEGHEPRIPS